MLGWAPCGDEDDGRPPRAHPDEPDLARKAATLIDTFQGDDDEGATGSRRSNGTINGTIAWPEDLLRRCYRESPPGMRVVFESLAARPGRGVTSEELASAIGKSKREPDYSREKLAGVLGAFGRRWKNRYKCGGRKDGAWPFRAEWNHDERMYIYTMDASVAEVFSKFVEERRASA